MAELRHSTFFLQVVGHLHGDSNREARYALEACKRQRERDGTPVSPSAKGSVQDFPGGPMVKNLSANAGDVGSIPGVGRPHMLWGS